MTLFVATVFMQAGTPAETRTTNADEAQILFNLSYSQCGNKTVWAYCAT
jgi:hypothetical protein